MMDEIFDRNYAAGRTELNASIGKGFDRLGKLIGDSFKVLHRIEWSAPWHNHKRARVN